MPNIEEIFEISEKLRMAVIATLNLQENEQVFVGNEEKLFLYALFQYMPSSSHPNTIKITNPKELTFFRMMDVWSGETNKRPETRKKQRLTEKVRNFIIWIRSLFIRLKDQVFLENKLKKSSVLIHYAAHIRFGSFVLPNLTSFFGGYKEEKDQNLRKEFSYNLSCRGLDPFLVTYLTELFPTSHLESYSKYTSNKISNFKNVKTVATSLVGIMDDPLLSFLVKNSKSKLIFVQHGGGYGLNDKRVEYQLEDVGCKTMYYWGTGEHNIYPSRYKNKSFPKMNSEIQLILSANKNKDKRSRDYYIAQAEKLESSHGAEVSIVAFPNADKEKFTYKNMRFGISSRDHQKSKLVIYDSVAQSLLFSRILSKRPFLVVDDFITDAHNPSAKKFLKLLKECNLLLSREDLLDRTLFWSSMSEDILVDEFIRSAEPFLNHVLDQPKLEETFIYNKR